MKALFAHLLVKIQREDEWQPNLEYQELTLNPRAYYVVGLLRKNIMDCQVQWCMPIMPAAL